MSRHVLMRRLSCVTGRLPSCVLSAAYWIWCNFCCSKIVGQRDSEMWPDAAGQPGITGHITGRSWVLFPGTLNSMSFRQTLAQILAECMAEDLGSAHTSWDDPQRILRVLRYSTYPYRLSERLLEVHLVIFSLTESDMCRGGGNGCFYIY